MGFFSIISGELRLLSVLLSLAGLLLMAGVSFYSIREIRRSRTLITESLPSFDDFVFQKDGEWVMDARLGKLIDALGSRIAQSGKMSILQGLGADAKNVKRLDKAAGTDLLDASGFGGILDILGLSNVKRELIKNPKLIAVAAQRFGPMIQNMAFRGPQTNKSNFGHDFSK